MMKDKPSAVSFKKAGGYRKWILFFLLVVIGGLVLYRGWASTQKKSSAQRGLRSEIPVQVLPVVRKPLTYSFVSTGDIAPLMQVDLFSKVSGYLERIDVHLGDPVRKGQVVAQIDQNEFLHKVKEIEAKLVQARANLSEIEAGSRPEELRQAEEAVKQTQSRFDNAKFHRERIEALYKRQVISKKESDTAEMEYSVAEAQLAASQQSFKLLKDGARQEVREASQAKMKEMEAILAQEKIRLQNTQIIAPFSGEIIRRYVDAGALVSPSTALVNLVHTETLKVLANVLERDVPLLKLGMSVKIKSESYPDKVFEGKVTRMNSALDLSTRTLQAEIYIPNPDRLLKPGMFARLELVLSEKLGALVVPRHAVIEAGGSKSIFIVQGNQALRKKVVTGYEQDQVVEILEGVSEGDQVVVRGQESIRDRSTVRVIEGG